jgi:hypothetical protein
MLRISRMASQDAINRLLEGNIDPSEIEENPSLFAMAERIYGREALEEIGVHPPEVGTPILPTPPTLIPDGVSLPDFQPEIPEGKKRELKKGQRKRGFIPILGGFMGIFMVLLNMSIGVGQVLCSTGITAWYHICDPEHGDTKVDWTKSYTYESLHEWDTWGQPMSADIVDLGLIVVFSTLVALGLVLRQRSVHAGDMLPSES